MQPPRFVSAVLALGLATSVMAQFQEVNGTAAVEAETNIEMSGGVYASDKSPTGAPQPLSKKALYIPCSARQTGAAKWKVNFTQAGKYQVWILGWGQGKGADNFNVFLGTEPDKLRALNSTQNCSYKIGSSCPNYEATMKIGSSSLQWSRDHQCIADRGCTGNTTTWTIPKPGTYLMGIKTGDEPFASHANGCADGTGKIPVPPAIIIIDKFLITKSTSTPSGAGPAAVPIGSTDVIDRGSPAHRTEALIIQDNDLVQVRTLSGKLISTCKGHELQSTTLAPAGAGLLLVTRVRDGRSTVMHGVGANRIR